MKFRDWVKGRVIVSSGNYINSIDGVSVTDFDILRIGFEAGYEECKKARIKTSVKDDELSIFIE